MSTVKQLNIVYIFDFINFIVLYNYILFILYSYKRYSQYTCIKSNILISAYAKKFSQRLFSAMMHVVIYVSDIIFNCLSYKLCGIIPSVRLAKNNFKFQLYTKQINFDQSTKGELVLVTEVLN